jgi:hypothetical protein
VLRQTDAVGLIYSGDTFGYFRLSVPRLIGAAVVLVIGLVCARYLRHRRRDPGLAEGV